MNKTIILLLMLLGWMSATAFAQKQTFTFKGGKFKIVQFTDLHWTPRSAGCADTEATIRSVLEAEQPALAVLSGDVVTDAPALEGWNAVIGLFDELKMPFVVTMGNHDAEYMSKDDIYSLLLQSPYYVGQKGPEDIKGCELTKESFRLLEEVPINFVGNVEADVVFEGASDVLISDGFAGNVLLKGVEGLAKSTMFWLKRVLTKNALRIVGAILAKNAFRELKAFGDADDIGGAPLLGINGICIIGHGSSSPKAVRNAIRVAGECVSFGLNERIVAKINEAGCTTAELEKKIADGKSRK